ncbi:hypothetical protein R6Q57_009322 [Mikania cordata]
MKGTLSATTTLPFFSKTLLHCSPAAAQICPNQLPLLRFQRITIIANAVFTTSPGKFGSNSPLFNRRNDVLCRLDCISSSAASFASSGGDSGGDGGVDDVSPLSSDVIILDVRGMMCGGCASSVKRILENQSQVSSANVDHTKETAIVWLIPEAKVTPNWQKVIGEELAKNLTNCGFESNLRGNYFLQYNLEISNVLVVTPLQLTHHPFTM